MMWIALDPAPRRSSCTDRTAIDVTAFIELSKSVIISHTVQKSFVFKSIQGLVHNV